MRYNKTCVEYLLDVHDTITIGDVKVTIMDKSNNNTRLSIDAPKYIPVWREEIVLKNPKVLQETHIKPKPQ